MKLTSEQIDGLMKLIGLTREHELTCDECLDQVSEFAEYQLTGKPVPAALEAIEHHLAICTECREEYDALRRALDGLNQNREGS